MFGPARRCSRTPAPRQSSRVHATQDDARGAVLAVTGLAVEARVARRAGFRALPAGRLVGTGEGLRAVLSFGLAGGLAPDVAAGTLIVAGQVISPLGSRDCDAALRARLLEALHGLPDPVVQGVVAGRDAPVLTLEAKRALHAESGAVAVDTESHRAAELAQGTVPFAVVRVVCDGAARALPPLVTSALGPRGGLDAAALVASLRADPRQALMLPGLARDFARAMRTLRRVGRVLGAAHL